MRGKDLRRWTRFRLPLSDSVDLKALTDAKLFVGRSPEQVAEFVEAEVEPIRLRYAGSLGQRAELKV